MVELPADIEQTLRDLPDAEWTALQARIRPPDTAEQVRTAAAKHVPADQLDSIMSIVDASKFVTDGTVDEAKVTQHFGRLFGVQQQSPPQRGQHSGQPSGDRPRETVQEALRRRHGVGAAPGEPGAGSQIPSGEKGREALARRHGVKK
jgi:hypothetical protein